MKNSKKEMFCIEIQNNNIIRQIFANGAIVVINPLMVVLLYLEDKF